MQEEKLVSIIIPAYKTEEYIEKCLKSVQEQTYKNLEIIVIDDKSPDATGEICDRIAKSDTRIKVIHHSINKGVSSARNSGLKIRTGVYTAFVDGDDIVASTLIEDCVRCIEKNQSDAVIFNLAKIENGQIIERRLDEKYFENSDTVFRAIIEDRIPNYLCNKFFRSSCWDTISLVENTEYEDLMSMPKVFEGVNSVSYLDKQL